MASNKNLLPTAVGPIKTDEVFTNAFVNCKKNPNQPNPNGPGTAIGYEVLYPIIPNNSGGKDLVPVIGGTVLKVNIGENAKYITDNEAESLKDANDIKEIIQNLLSRYNQQIDRLKNSINSNITEASDAGAFDIDELVEARNLINRALEDMPGLSENWKVSSIPVMQLASLIVSNSQFTNATDLQKKIDEDNQDSVPKRNNNLRTIGGFKFIPINVIKKIFDDCILPKMAKFKGFTGKTFEELSKFGELKDGVYSNLNDDLITNVILELFTIFRIKDISNPLGNEISGYYTAHNGFLYVKMPDMSGRNLDGDSEDPFDYDNEETENTFVFLELYQEVTSDITTYIPLVLEAASSPSPSLVEDGLTDIETLDIEISKDGLGKVDGLEFYLSPIINIDASTKVEGFVREPNGLELSSFPAINYTIDNLTNEQIYSIFTTLKKSAYLNLDKILGVNTQSISSSVQSQVQTRVDVTNALKNLLQKTGLPLGVSLSFIGISSAQYLLGEMNKPEVLIGSRGDKAEAKNGSPESNRFFDPKTPSTKPIMASVRPNIIDASEISEDFWIKLDKSLEDDKIILKIPSNLISDDPKNKDVKFYTVDGKIEFALYIHDKNSKQIVRMPGNNIVVEAPAIEAVAGDPVRDGDKINISIQIKNKGKNVKKEDISNIKIGTLINFIILKPNETKNGIKFDLDNERIVVENIDDLVNKFGQVTKLPAIILRKNGKKSAKFDIFFGDLKDKPKEENQLGFDKLKLNGLRFPGGLVHSIPLLLDGSQATISIKASRGVFSNPNIPIYSYLLIKQNTITETILSQDFGFLNKDFKEITLPELTDGSKDQKYYALFSIKNKAGDANLKIVNTKQLDINFPGSYDREINISRFYELEQNLQGTQNTIYYLITSQEITESSSGAFEKDDEGFYNYGLLPVGKPGDIEKPAFVRPPYIVGMVADLPGKSGAAIVSNRRVKDFDEGTKDSIAINIDSLNNSDNYQIITSDELDKLSIVFYGAEEPNKRSLYSFKIGTKQLNKTNIFTPIRFSNGKLVANLKNIRRVEDVGWTEVLITKNDKRFKTSYTSKLHNISTILLKKDGDKAPIKEQGVSGNGIFKLDPESNFNIYTHLVNLEPSTVIKSALIFPDVFSGSNFNNLSSLPIVPDNLGNILSLNDNKYLSTDFAKAYLNFSNPISLEPSFEIVIGQEFSNGTKYGVVLDGDETQEERIITISPDGTSSSLNPTAFVDSINNGIKKGEELLKQLETAKDKLCQELGPDSQDCKDQVAEINDKTQKYNDTKEQASQTAADVSAALPVNTTSDQDSNNQLTDLAQGAGQATAIVKDLLAELTSVTDKLSSASNLANKLLEDLSSSASGSSVPNIIKTNFSNIFVSNNAQFTSRSFIYNGENEYKLFLTTKYNKAAAIQFNQPKIISIRFGDEQESVSNLKQLRDKELKNYKSIYVLTVGADKDTKFEISGVRVKATIVSYQGIYKEFKIVVPDISKLPTYGPDNCIKISLTNSNKKRIKAIGQLGNDIGLQLDDKYNQNLKGGGRRKQGSNKALKGQAASNPLRFANVLIDSAAVPKDAIRSFCDFSFHMNAELQANLRTFQVILVPVKVIFCIIDVICALLNPFALVFAIIRLFLCLYDLILLLPQISVPAMALSLILHILEVIYCIIITVLGIVTAINEIITAIQNAIEQQNYASIVALEEVLNEHLLSVEAELSILDPIFSIIGIFLELLQLTFAFPCRISPLDDEPSCIDPSQLSSLVLSRVAPSGRIEPDNLLPLAQTYTTITLDDLGSRGNTPQEVNDPISVDVGDTKPYYGTTFGSNGVLIEPKEMITSVISVPTSGGTELPGTLDFNTGENKTTSAGSFFADAVDGKISNIDYSSLRFNGPNLLGKTKIINGAEQPIDTVNSFQATFSLSYTKTTKPFNLLVGQDPRVINFEFNSAGLTNPLAFTFLGFLFRKKAIDINATLDQPPSFLFNDNGSMKISPDTNVPDMVSPIDGIGENTFLTANITGNTATFTPKPLTITFELQQPTVNPATALAEFIPQTVTRTFGNIPMIALMDDEFNTYFIQDDGIHAEKEDGVWKIKKITAKIINQTSAGKKAYSIEDKSVFEKDLSSYNIDGFLDEGSADEADGSIIIKQQANADYVTSVSGLIFDPPGSIYNPQDGDGINLDYSIDILPISTTSLDVVFTDLDGTSVTMTIPAGSLTSYPYPDYSAVDHSRGKPNQINALTNAVRIQDIFDFPKLYIVDMRQLADEISAACSASGPNQLLLDQFDDFTPVVEKLDECLTAYRDFFVGDQVDANGVPSSVVERIRYSLDVGLVPSPISVDSVIQTHEELQGCLEDLADNACNFVINPLNTSFKILNDTDETARTDVVNPESQDLTQLINSGLLTQTEVDAALAGFPTITGAMEYASGVGDLAIIPIGDKAFIQIIPRDSYDKVIQDSYDLSQKIDINFVIDETNSASLVPVEEGSDSLVVKSGGSYTFAISANNPGKVVIRANVCKVIVQAVTDRGIVQQTNDPNKIDCIPDVNADGTLVDETFAPGALTKIDRNLTILFVARKVNDSKYGDDDRQQSARSAKTNPQTFGTKLSN